MASISGLTNSGAQDRLGILLVEDNLLDARLLQEKLQADNLYTQFEFTHAPTLTQGLQRLAAGRFDVAMLDLNLPDSQGLETLEKTLAAAPTLPIIVFTGATDEQAGMEAVRRGAEDYLMKNDASGATIARAIRYAVERNRITTQLRALNETLEQRVAERTRLAEHRSEQLRALAMELTQVEQHERRRLAQILHDNLQQLLVGAKFGLSAAQRMTTEPKVLQALRNACDVMDQSIGISRSLTVQLSPAILYEASLDKALAWLAQLMKQQHGLEVELDLDETIDPIDEDIRILLFHAVRELLFNVIKHAQVTTVRLRTGVAGSSQVCVMVEDQGVGFVCGPSSLRAGGFGLFSIRERLEVLGGRLEVQSTPGQGTRAVLLAPIHRGNGQADE